MVDVGHAIDHTGIVLPEYGGNAFSRKFLQESLTGGLSLQGGSDSFLRLYGYGMSGNSLFAFHKFLLECLVAYAFTDLAGFDGYAGPFSFFIGSRIDQSMIGLSLYRLVGLFHRYMEKAKQGIRFITPGYKEIFRIPDGDSIRIFTGGGGTRDRTCRFIDETHFETSGDYPSALYHICEFAERLEKTHGSVIPLRSSLPPHCFSILPSSGELIIITRGEKGYLLSEMKIDGKSNREVADIANAAVGTTKAQEAAMLAGSMFGWQTPAADPKNYDEQGQPIRPKQKDRGDAR